jgi:hypothetical protein
MGEKKDGGNNRTRKAKGLRGMRETGDRKGGGKMVGFRNGAEGKWSKQNWAHWHIHANKNRVTDDGEGQSVEDSQPAARVDSTTYAVLGISPD